jgi:hypothetical protein
MTIQTYLWYWCDKDKKIYSFSADKCSTKCAYYKILMRKEKLKNIKKKEF